MVLLTCLLLECSHHNVSGPKPTFGERPCGETWNLHTEREMPGLLQIFQRPMVPAPATISLQPHDRNRARTAQISPQIVLSC